MNALFEITEKPEQIYWLNNNCNLESVLKNGNHLHKNQKKDFTG